MKKLTLIILCYAALCLSTGSVMADIYRMDKTTAAGMRLLDWSAVDDVTLTYVGYNPGGLGDRVFGDALEYNAGEGNMLYEVGFSGNVSDTDGTGLASLTLGLTNPGLSGTFDSFELPIANGDDDVWNYRSYVKTVDDTFYSDWTLGVVPGSIQTLVASTLGLDYSSVTNIGFSLEYERSKNGGQVGDDYSVSVVNPVPVPGAVLLGMIGLGIGGVKLRRFA